MDKGKQTSHSDVHYKSKKKGKYDVHVTVHATADEILKATLQPTLKNPKKKG